MADRQEGVAATGDLRDAADYVVEHEDIATAANLLRSAQDEIDRLRSALGFYAVVKDVNAVSILLADCGRHARKVLGHPAPVESLLDEDDFAVIAEEGI